MASRETVPLRDDEIEELYRELDQNEDGKVTFQELERVLKQVHNELAPDVQRHHLTQPERSHASDANSKTRNTQNEEKTTPQNGHHDSDLQDFLSSLTYGCGEAMSKDEFFEQVRSWNIPSQDQTCSDQNSTDAREYHRKLSRKRRLLAWWAVHGQELIFALLVGGLILAFSLWQGLFYATSSNARAALGGGVIAAKFSAGALYPTFFFLILSMSRWFATFWRGVNLGSRFINWDLSQTFHIWMSSLALVFSLIHVIGHLSGTFVYASSSNRQAALRRLLGTRYARLSYSEYIASRAGWSGLTAIISFFIIALTSLPTFRKKHYEIFQLAHLLMYLIFTMLAIHGTANLLQKPILGYILAFPVMCVLLERIRRLYLTFFGHHHARLEALDDGTVVITVEKPEGQKWRARAGQYILLQVPQVSRFQWHPFTISACIGNRLQIHIKASGNWTGKLHKLASVARTDGETDYTTFKVSLDGPFGAPAQRFYTFDKTIIVGSGIGVTPFAACLTDLEENLMAEGDPWRLTPIRSFVPTRSRTGRMKASPLLPRASIESEITAGKTPSSAKNDTRVIVKPLQIRRKEYPGSLDVRRCDFHWSVREKNDLLWFSGLLNRAGELAQRGQQLTLNIHAHITAKRGKLSTYVFRYLLDNYRTEEFPYSALTGLRIKSEFGRPDYEAILTEFYEDMKEQGWHGPVGIFHCGPPLVGKILADLCAQLTARAAKEAKGMRFMFHDEVFG